MKTYKEIKGIDKDVWEAMDFPAFSQLYLELRLKREKKNGRTQTKH